MDFEAIEVEDEIIGKIVRYVVESYSENIIPIYGIGSYFDDSLLFDWQKNDLDIVVIVKTLETLPKQKWTETRYEKKKMDHYEVWIGYNTVEGFQSKEAFEKESFTNYKWSVIELMYPENSEILYGTDIRDKLPNLATIEFDYDDILARSLYHLEKSLQLQNKADKRKVMQKEFTKAVFKLGFYFCVFFDPQYYLTSIRIISEQVERLEKEGKIGNVFIEVLKQCIQYRRIGKFGTDFERLRENFLVYLGSLFNKGLLHKKWNKKQLPGYLNSYFSGFPHLISFFKQF